jgi:hypothetical protein
VQGIIYITMHFVTIELPQYILAGMASPMYLAAPNQNACSAGYDVPHYTLINLYSSAYSATLVLE